MEVAWAQPWYAPWRAPGERVARAVAHGAALHEALNAVGAAPVRFVPHEALPPGTCYESFVFATRRCPVRPGLHAPRTSGAIPVP